MEIRTRQQGPARTAVALVRPPTVELAQAEQTRAARRRAAQAGSVASVALAVAAVVPEATVASAEVVVMGASLDKAVLAE